MVVLGSECCKETIITAVKDIGHLRILGLSPRVFMQKTSQQPCEVGIVIMPI